MTAAPVRGWPGAGRGRASFVEPPVEYQATTVQACGLFPFVAGSGAPTAGVPRGRHLLWGEVVCCDPFAWMDAGLTTNRGVFLLGQPGTGKSSAGKRICRALMAFGVVLFTAYVTTTVDGGQDLDEAVADVEARADQSKLRLRRLHGSQAAGFAATLPCGVLPGLLAARGGRR